MPPPSSHSTDHPPATATCQCGTTTMSLPLPTPLGIYYCHCTQCRRQSGSAFGTSAIFPYFDPRSAVPPSAVQHLGAWERTAASGRRVECWFCRVCGVRMAHVRYRKGEREGEWVPVETVSVKGGIVDGLSWEGGVHIWVREAVVPIPEGAERWEEEPDD